MPDFLEAADEKPGAGHLRPNGNWCRPPWVLDGIFFNGPQPALLQDSSGSAIGGLAAQPAARLAGLQLLQ